MARIQSLDDGFRLIRNKLPVQGGWWRGARLTLGIIILNIVIWFVFTITSKIVPNFPQFVLDYFANSNAALFEHYRIWCPITSAFLHFDFMHLFFNMILLLFFAPQLERDFGSKRFLIFFLLCAVGGSMVSLLAKFLMSNAVPSIGASGAVMGVIIAYGLSYPRQTVYFWGLWPIKMLTLVIGIVIIQFGTALQNDPNSCVDTFCHLGGLATGFLYMKIPQSKGSAKPPGSKRIRNWRGQEAGEERSYYLEL